MSEKEVQKSDPKSTGPKRRSWPQRVAFWFCNCVFFVFLAAMGLALFITDRPITAPSWLREQIEARISENAPGIQLSFGQMMVIVGSGLRPSIQLQDVTIDTAEGQQIVALSELQASLAFEPLLDGQVQPKSVSLSGIFATLSRDAQGRLDLIASDVSGASSRQADTVSDLVEQIDALFLLPEMTALQSLVIDGVTLRFEDGLARRVWTIDGARLIVDRQGDELTMSSDLAILGGGSNASTVSVNYNSDIGRVAASFGISVTDLPAKDLAAISPAFGWLGGLDAPLSGALRGGLQADGALSPVNAFLEIGAGVLQPTPQTSPVPFKSAQAYLVLEPTTGELVFDELSIDSAWVKGSLDGRARLSGLETGRLRDLVGQFSLSGLEIDQPELYDAPLQFEGAELDFRLVPDPFRLDIGQMRILDQGQSLRMSAQLEAAPDGWHAAVNATMDQVTPTRLMELWPEGAVDKTRTWISDNVLQADLTDIQFSLRTEPTSKPDTSLLFSFSDTDLLYLKSFPPIIDARGTASILRNRFALSVIEGDVVAPQGGKVAIDGSAFVIPDVSVRRSVPAEVYLETDASITATLALLDLPPLNILSRADLPVTVADGRARASTTLKLPLQTKVTTQDVAFDVIGTLGNVRSSRLVPNRRIEAPELRVEADNAQVRIAGNGRFDSVPVDVVWQQILGRDADGSSTLSGNVELSNASVTALNLGLPPGSVTGTGSGNIQIALPRGGAPTYTLTSDLSGVGLRIPQIGWSLAQGTRGALSVSGTLGDQPRVDRLVLDAPGLSAEGSVALRAGGGLAQAEFRQLRVGGWLDAPVTLVGRGAGASPAIQVRGGSLDLRNAEFGSGGGGGSGGPVSLALDSLRITDTIALRNMRGTFEVRNGLQGSFTGRVNGEAPITGEVLPQRGRSAFRIKSDDAGAVFSAAGLLKQARGGDMTVSFQPVGTAGAFNGALTVKNTRITDAPAIAELFNALSVVGLLEQMNGQGLHFANVDAAFRLTSDKVTLTQASATGPSIGLSMDGVYDVNSSVMDMQGVFSPLYLINGVGSLFTRRGEGLIGFNFSLKGPAAKPNVQVNPLSALTPSFFREIFRRPPPDVALEPGEQPGNAPRAPTPEPPKPRKKQVLELGAGR